MTVSHRLIKIHMRLGNSEPLYVISSWRCISWRCVIWHNTIGSIANTGAHNGACKGLAYTHAKRTIAGVTLQAQ